MDETAIRKVVTRLARPTKTGGHVIERAAVLAEGADFGAIEAWIIESGGKPETLADATGGGGVHSRERDTGRTSTTEVPARYLLPAGAMAAREASTR